MPGTDRALSGLDKRSHAASASSAPTDACPGPDAHAERRLCTGIRPSQCGDQAPHLSLLSFDEGTLVEVLVRLDIASLAHTASSCRPFASMCRCEWLWQRLCCLRGIRVVDAPGSGWRGIYVALSQVDVVGWAPLTSAELRRLCRIFGTLSMPTGHKALCVEMELSAVAGTESLITGKHEGSFSFGGERWICRLSSALDDSDEGVSADAAAGGTPEPGADAPPEASVYLHLARVASDLTAEPPGWFHIFSAQSHFILAGRPAVGPTTNGVIALGTLPAGLQVCGCTHACMHICECLASA